MAARYGHAWASQYGGGADAMAIAYAEWGETLAGLNAEELMAGFAADVLRGDRWPPSSPEFRALCLRIPSFAEVKHEIEHLEVPRTGFVALMWRDLTSYDLANSRGREYRQLLENAYELARTHVLAGGKVPDMAQPLPPPKPAPRTPAKPETVEKCKADINRVLGLPVESEAKTEATPA